MEAQAVVSGMAPRFGNLDLQRSLGASSWLGDADGQQVVARPVAPGAVPVPRLPPLPDPAAYVPVLGTAEHAGSCWLLSERITAASLRRLTGAASLTPVQAAVLAAQLLHAVEELHAAGHSHGRLTATNVLVDAHGMLRICDWAPGWTGSAAGQRADVDAMCALVSLLATDARRAGRLPDAHVVAALDRCTTADGTSLRSAVEELRSAVGAEHAGVAAQAAAELAAVVGELTTRTDRPFPVVAVRSPAPATPSPAAERAPAATAHRRAGIAAVAVILVAVAGVLAYLTTRPGAAPAREAAAGAPHRGAAMAAGIHPNPPATSRPAAAPASTSQVRGISLSMPGNCPPGQSCAVRVVIALRAHSGTEYVRWKLLATSCDGTRDDVHDGVMTAQPGWTRVFTTVDVQLPGSGRLTVVASTAPPASAASAPLQLPPGGRC